MSLELQCGIDCDKGCAKGFHSWEACRWANAQRPVDPPAAEIATAGNSVENITQSQKAAIGAWLDRYESAGASENFMDNYHAVGPDKIPA